jgi:hypothetical protein
MRFPMNSNLTFSPLILLHNTCGTDRGFIVYRIEAYLGEKKVGHITLTWVRLEYFSEHWPWDIWCTWKGFCYPWDYDTYRRLRPYQKVEIQNWLRFVTDYYGNKPLVEWIQRSPDHPKQGIATARTRWDAMEADPSIPTFREPIAYHGAYREGRRRSPNTWSKERRGIDYASGVFPTTLDVGNRLSGCTTAPSSLAAVRMS